MDTNYLKRIRTANINAEIEAVMEPFFSLLKRKKECVGIVRLGGLARRAFSDRHSDVDGSIFVEGEPEWLPMFEFYVPMPGGGYYEINVHQNTLAREEEREWEEAKREAYEEGMVEHDPSGKVRELLEKKVRFDDTKALERAGQIFSALKSYKPSEPLNDHLAINKMLNQTVELAFIANREFRPHKKWRLEKARYLPFLPGNFSGLLEEALLVREISAGDAARRVSAVWELARFFLREETEVPAPSPSAPEISEVAGMQQRMLTLIFGQFYWLVDVNPLRQIERGFIYNGHDLLNEGTGMVIEALRVLRGEPLRQCVEALSVLSPRPEYREDQYELWPDFGEFRDLEAAFKDALFVHDFSSAHLRRRAELLQIVTHAMQAKVQAAGLIPEDPYHFALFECYFDRQLRKRTFAEEMTPPGISGEEQTLVQGFISYHLAGSKEELSEALRHPLPAYSSEPLAAIRALLS